MAVRKDRKHNKVQAEKKIRAGRSNKRFSLPLAAAVPTAVGPTAFAAKKVELPGGVRPAVVIDAGKEAAGSDVATNSQVWDVRKSAEPDPRVVESVTDRIFSSVLSRYGWERQDGRIEHVGEDLRHTR